MMITYLTCLLLMISLFSTAIAIFGSNHLDRIVLPLIHRDSVLSPFYNPSFTISDIANHSSYSSLARLAYIKAKIHDDDTIRAPLIASENGITFFLNISIGQPPVSQLMIMDTGSSITWVQCHPCHRCIRNAASPVFDPTTSSTYTKLLCSSDPCNSNFVPVSCVQQFCEYDVIYMDMSSSRGILSSDKFTFETSNGGTVEIPDVVFGCGFDNHEPSSKSSGILGLQARKYSLNSRLGNKFSYCIGNLSDPGYMYNQLILGDGAVMEGYSTPMRISNGFFIVSLEGISVGDKTLSINQPVAFYLQLIVDSGTTLTYLKTSWFQPLMQEINYLLDGVVEPITFPNEGPCYAGNWERDLRGFPVVTLHLSGGCDLVLDVEAMFQRRSSNVFCSAIAESVNGLNVLGVLAQQYYNVGFDLNEMTVSFQSIECELLED